MTRNELQINPRFAHTSTSLIESYDIFYGKLKLGVCMLAFTFDDRIILEKVWAEIHLSKNLQFYDVEYVTIVEQEKIRQIERLEKILVNNQFLKKKIREVEGSWKFC